ncbi:hypothetical protein RB195_005069 [Necator americanus]|uniref:PB1 domain protein n=1 Tax=Necator americanus TaxID=51031 RepID=A0ABR1BPX0_NECAM
MAGEEKFAILKLYRGSAPRLRIDYTDKNDLYEKFMEKINRLNYPVGEIYTEDDDYDRLLIKNADDLYAAARYNGPQLKVHVLRAPEHDVFSCPSNDEEKEERKEGESLKELHARRRSRSEPRHGSRHHAGHYYYPIPWNYPPWIDLRYGRMPFFSDPQGFSKDHEHQKEGGRNCQCERLSQDFAKI